MSTSKKYRITGVLVTGLILIMEGYLFPRSSWGESITWDEDFNSHYVLMEYEAWFGPKASKWNPQIDIFPILSSDNMRPFGGGYDSRDPKVIEQHYLWFLDMDIDAIILDHTNNIACTFSPDTFNQELPELFLKKYRENDRNIPLEYETYFAILGWLPTLNSQPKDDWGDQEILRFLKSKWGCRPGDVFQIAMDTIKSNNAEIFNLFSRFAAKYHRPIKIVPLVGGFEPTAWEKLPSKNYRSSMDLQVEFYRQLFEQYPELQLTYLGKPLLLSYFAAPTAVHLFSQLDAHLNGSDWNQFTIRKMGGYLSNQLDLPQFSGMGSSNLPKFKNLWTWIDRLQADIPHNLLGPSYSTTLDEFGQSKVEAFTVTMANPAPDGWGDSTTLIPTDRGSLRRGGQTFRDFMNLASDLQPQFLIINQFNEFAQPDQGWNEETTNDIEPTHLWGTKYIDLVQQEIATYRSRLPYAPQPRPNTPSFHEFSFSEFRAQTEIWPPSNLMDENPYSCYSSFPSSVNNPSGEFIAGWFPSPDMPTINSLEITPRIVYGTVLSFPPSFDLYVTSEDNSRWVFVKTYFQSELTLTAEEKYVVPLAKSFQTWGILIVPKEIGFDDYGNYYFQLCGIKALLQR